MSKAVAYDNIVEGGGVMMLDDDNNPIILEQKVQTTANKFDQAVEEDLKQIDPTIQVNNVYDTEVVEEKTMIHPAIAVAEPEKAVEEVIEKAQTTINK